MSFSLSWGSVSDSVVGSGILEAHCNRKLICESIWNECSRLWNSSHFLLRKSQRWPKWPKSAPMSYNYHEHVLSQMPTTYIDVTINVTSGSDF